MKRAPLAVLLVLSLSVFARAAAGLDGNWIAAVNPDDTGAPRVQLMLASEEDGKVSGWIDHSHVRFAIKNFATAGNIITFDGVEQRVQTEDNAPLLTVACSGVFDETAIDINCEVPGGTLFRYLLTPHIGS